MSAWFCASGVFPVRSDIVAPETQPEGAHPPCVWACAKVAPEMVTTARRAKIDAKDRNSFKLVALILPDNLSIRNVSSIFLCVCLPETLGSFLDAPRTSLNAGSGSQSRAGRQITQDAMKSRQGA